MQQIYQTVLIYVFSITLMVLMPAAAMATTTATTSTSTPLINPSSIQEVMDTEEIAHARISINNGVPKRISSSPSGLIDFKISPSSVLNQQLLEIYARKLALTAPIDEMTIDDASVTMTITGTARLFGFIPVGLPHTVEAQLEGRDLSVTVHNTTSWSWLAAKSTPTDIATQIKQEVSQANYFSATQLKAYVLESIVGVITT